MRRVVLGKRLGLVGVRGLSTEMEGRVAEEPQEDVPSLKGCSVPRASGRANLTSPQEDSPDQIVDDLVLMTRGRTRVLPSGKTWRAGATVLPMLQLRKRRLGRSGFLP